MSDIYGDEFASPRYFNAIDFDNKIVTIDNLNTIVSNIIQKKVYSFEIPVDDTARDIPFLPTRGAFIISVQGSENEMPCLTVACSKSTAGSAGSVSALDSQAGTGATWNANVLSITSTATNFQIAHDLAATVGTFYITLTGWI